MLCTRIGACHRQFLVWKTRTLQWDGSRDGFGVCVCVCWRDICVGAWCWGWVLVGFLVCSGGLHNCCSFWCSSEGHLRSRIRRAFASFIASELKNSTATTTLNTHTKHTHIKQSTLFFFLHKRIGVEEFLEWILFHRQYIWTSTKTYIDAWNLSSY